MWIEKYMYFKGSEIRKLLPFTEQRQIAGATFTIHMHCHILLSQPLRPEFSFPSLFPCAYFNLDSSYSWFSAHLKIQSSREPPLTLQAQVASNSHAFPLNPWTSPSSCTMLLSPFFVSVSLLDYNFQDNRDYYLCIVLTHCYLSLWSRMETKYIYIMDDYFHFREKVGN